MNDLSKFAVEPLGLEKSDLRRGGSIVRRGGGAHWSAIRSLAGKMGELFDSAVQRSPIRRHV